MQGLTAASGSACPGFPALRGNFNPVVKLRSGPGNWCMVQLVESSSAEFQAKVRYVMQLRWWDDRNRGNRRDSVD